jgi:hypothetical protein
VQSYSSLEAQGRRKRRVGSGRAGRSSCSGGGRDDLWNWLGSQKKWRRKRREKM